MGVRLEGPELKRADASDMISEAVAPGTIQVPPSGKPILLLGDCQTIGGEPKKDYVLPVGVLIVPRHLFRCGLMFSVGCPQILCPPLIGPSRAPLTCFCGCCVS